MSRLRLNQDDEDEDNLQYGVQNNDVTPIADVKPSSGWNIGPAIGNFSIQYNLSCASIAVDFMTAQRNRGGNETVDYPEPEWASYVLLGVVFVGAVCGMLVMGYLGDLIGRRRAMVVTLTLNVVGALGSGLLSWGSTGTIYIILSLCRFFLGMGVGGIYPLSAVSSAETSKEGEHSGKRVGWAFFWQTPGSMAPYVVSLMLLFLNGPKWVTSFQFRCILSLGALPAAINMFLELRKDDEDSAQFKSQRVKNPLTEAFRHPEYFRTFIGTGTVWPDAL